MDIALARKPFVQASMASWTWVAKGEDKPMVAPHSLATFYYMVRQAHGNTRAMEAVHDLLETGRVTTFDEACANNAMSLGFSDFEDAMVAAAAVSSDSELILTRNEADFKLSPVPCQTPEAFVAKLTKT
ncbi:MAG: hypothetical protein JJU29_19950 [Verrucomicrobia bacterium]|nr:hypothetical protein [Verrucomicrobiota bacterium]